MSKALYKTTIVIWSEFDPRSSHTTIEELAREADEGDCYCTYEKTIKVNNPINDPDFNNCDFFDLNKEEEECFDA